MYAVFVWVGSSMSYQFILLIVTKIREEFGCVLSYKKWNRSEFLIRIAFFQRLSHFAYILSNFRLLNVDSKKLKRPEWETIIKQEPVRVNWCRVVPLGPTSHLLHVTEWWWNDDGLAKWDCQCCFSQGRTKPHHVTEWCWFVVCFDKVGLSVLLLPEKYKLHNRTFFVWVDIQEE